MFDFDERLTDLVLEHCRRRLSLVELPLGFGGTRTPREGVLEGLLCEEGNDPARVLELFLGELSSSVLASDSARYRDCSGRAAGGYGLLAAGIQGWCAASAVSVSAIGRWCLPAVLR